MHMCGIDIVILYLFFYDYKDKHLVEVDPNISKHKYSNNLSKNLVKEKLEGDPCHDKTRWHGCERLYPNNLFKISIKY
jgi:hypothetical protein